MAIPQRILGKTGIEVAALGLGGVCWNLLDEDKDAIAVVLRAIDHGITYLDTASSYKQSERRLGLALMERLQLETIDLMQLHAIDEEENLVAMKVMAYG